MSEKLKPRKLVPNFNQDQKWRNKIKPNISSKRYSRECILQKYEKSDSLPINVPEDILILFEPNSLLSSLTVDGFSHGLGDSINSRKFAQREKKTEKTPEWFETTEEEKKEDDGVKEQDGEQDTNKEIIEENSPKIEENQVDKIIKEEKHNIKEDIKAEKKEIVLDAEKKNAMADKEQKQDIEEKKLVKENDVNDKNKSKQKAKKKKKEPVQRTDIDKKVANPLEKHERSEIPKEKIENP